ncbi:MAG: hypothetical protein JKY56_10955 [Kofleriaceae bacterium]|nr:hypothetical protein [Kofleriaceae bacterium]
MRFGLIVVAAAGCAQGFEAVDPDAAGQRPIDAAILVDAAADANVGQALCAAALETLRFDFEGSAQGFVHGKQSEVIGESGWTFDHWEQGPASGTTICPSGNECWGTNLSGNYIQCQRAYLVSPQIDLSACGSREIEPRILLEHNYSFWFGQANGGQRFDGGIIEISGDGSTWQRVNLNYPGTIDINPNLGSSYACVEQDNFYVDGQPGFVGTSGGWVTESFTVPFSLATVSFQIRFLYAAGVSSQTTDQTQSMSGTAPGWYLDNLRFQ